MSPVQLDQFNKYYELLVEWNSFMNLTAITDKDEVILKHFVDSLALGRYMNLQNETIIDVGTGAGFPGIPIKIAYPNVRLTLVDSLNKRIKFLDTVIDCLGLTDVVTIHSRAEDLAHNSAYREKYDLCIPRAVANLSTLSELCIPFVRPGGRFIPYKSEKTVDEIESATKAFSLLGATVDKVEEYTLPDSDIQRTLIFISKEKPTPSKYPRKAGTPSKDPL